MSLQTAARSNAGRGSITALRIRSVTPNICEEDSRELAGLLPASYVVECSQT